MDGLSTAFVRVIGSIFQSSECSGMHHIAIINLSPNEARKVADMIFKI